MDAVFLSRIQFALTVGFHFLFPPITIGLAWILVITEYLGWRKNDEAYVRLSKFLAKVLGLTFAVGVATGIVMEFQFGTNWAEYSKFVGDIFGAPLAAEGVLAFFLESGFLGLYIFGRSRISKGTHWFSILMVAIGATISAFWILVANSWQQTPTSYVVQNGRAELLSFWGAVFNPSTLPRFGHTIAASLVAGAFMAAGLCAALLLRNKNNRAARKGLKTAIIFGFIVSVLEVFPFGDIHARQVAKTQPVKFAALEAVYETQTNAPMVLCALPRDNPPRLDWAIEVPSLLSLMTFGDLTTPVKGINEAPPDERPPLALTFISFRLMVVLGMAFIAVTGLALLLLLKNRLYENRRFLRVLVWMIPLPLIACQFGWIAAEVGRQPWIVYNLLKTRDAASLTVGAPEILFSIIMFSLIYLFLGTLYIFLLQKKVKEGTEPPTSK